MSELIREFSMTRERPGGETYVAHVRAEQDEDGHWHGWIEFLPQDGGPALQTGRETMQIEREDLEYWASGLTDSYLEMALERTHPTDSRTPPPPPQPEPG